MGQGGRWEGASCLGEAPVMSCPPPRSGKAFDQKCRDPAALGVFGFIAKGDGAHSPGGSSGFGSSWGGFPVCSLLVGFRGPTAQ